RPHRGPAFGVGPPVQRRLPRHRRRGPHDRRDLRWRHPLRHPQVRGPPRRIPRGNRTPLRPDGGITEKGDTEAPMTVPARSDSSETSPAPITRRSVVLIFLALMLAMLLASLNQTVLSTALPTMVGELNGVDQMPWVMTAFILASTIMMPIYGKLRDLVGRHGLFVAAVSLCLAGAVIGGLAPAMDWLATGRVVQGLGGGGLMIRSKAIIADIAPARLRGRYAGFVGAVFAVSSVAG